MKKIAIYIRVSTLEQANNGHSLAMQERVLKKWCSDREYVVVAIYVERGISGKNMNHRPEILRLMHDAENHMFDIVLVWSLSRFTRSVSDLYITMEKFNKWNIGIISYTESFDTSSPTGRAMIGIIGVFAQLERELTSERVAAAIAERAAQGKRTCNEVLGYNISGKDTFNINKKEAEYIRFYYSEYLQQKSLAKVAVLAREKGYHGKRGGIPTAWSIRRILTNPIYCGYNSLNGKIYRGNYPAIISPETFNRVQALLISHGSKVGYRETPI